MAKIKGEIIKISGPLVIAKNMKNSCLYDFVKVGNLGLIGEIIEIHGDNASIQVYEQTYGLKPNEQVVCLEQPLSIELGPGLIGGIFDGIGRPLVELNEKTGNRLKRGFEVDSLNREKIWKFSATVMAGEILNKGAIVGNVFETEAVIHKIMLPPNISGKLIKISDGSFKVTDTIGEIKTDSGVIYPITLMQKSPVRKQRPYLKKLIPNRPLITGQRIIDFMFPIAKGGVAAVPGPFGSGKTIVQHQLAKWADADIIIYIGCGERGNEITDVLNEFSNIKNPKTKKTLMDKTILIANTSDMPVAAREASIYTGITIAEYFKDMGYDVALMADSTSRWAEALREMSSRLKEIPGEEGYPAYLSSRLAEFYERAGRFINLNNEEATISIVGAVSPPGGDISEPVSQATLKIVKVFWNLDYSLAYRRHFPAINWLKSYSMYSKNLEKWFTKNIAIDWNKMTSKILEILQEEARLEETIKLIGINSITNIEKLKLATAKSIREDFLHQNAFNKTDSYTNLKKQWQLISLILYYHNSAINLVNCNIDPDKLIKTPSKEKIARFKYVSDNDAEKTYLSIISQIDLDLINLKQKN